MARYSAFLGRRVEVQYRAGDIFLRATGTFAADTGRSIFLEESLVQRDKERHFRWEIPYACIVRIEEKPQEPAPPSLAPVRATTVAAAGKEERVASPPLLSLQNRPKEA